MNSEMITEKEARAIDVAKRSKDLDELKYYLGRQKVLYGVSVTMSTLERLEKKGLVTKHESPPPFSTTRYRVTPAGDAAYAGWLQEGSKPKSKPKPKPKVKKRVSKGGPRKTPKPRTKAKKSKALSSKRLDQILKGESKSWTCAGPRRSGCGGGSRVIG